MVAGGPVRADYRGVEASWARVVLAGDDVLLRERLASLLGPLPAIGRILGTS